MHFWSDALVYRRSNKTSLLSVMAYTRSGSCRWLGRRPMGWTGMDPGWEFVMYGAEI